MLTSELRDLFVASYKLECSLRGIKEIIFPEQLLALWISAGQQEILDELNLLVKPYTIYYEAQTTSIPYTLPDDYGKFLKTEPEYDTVDIQSLNATSQGDITRIAIFNDGDGWKIALGDLPSVAGSFKLWYRIGSNLYSQSTGGDDIGGFNNATFSGSLLLPDRYNPLLLLYLKTQCFPDLKAEYQLKIAKLKGDTSSTYKTVVNYNLGGYSAD